MTVENPRDELLGLLEQIHSCANHLKDEVIALHQTVRFDHQSPGARETARRIESELGQLAEGLRHFRKVFEAEEKRPA